MRLYLKGNYETSIYQTCMEFPWKMWFKERKGVEVGFSYAFNENFYLSLTLDKFSSNDERWGMPDFSVGNDPWATFKRENLNLNFENSYESDGREKGDCLRIITTHKDILTVDKRALYIMAIEVASVIDGQISEDDKETWLSVEFKTKHKDLLNMTYDEAVDISLEELEIMEAVDEPLWDELHRGWEEYIKIHGERVYDDEEDE